MRSLCMWLEVFAEREQNKGRGLERKTSRRGAGGAGEIRVCPPPCEAQDNRYCEEPVLPSDVTSFAVFLKKHGYIFGIDL